VSVLGADRRLAKRASRAAAGADALTGTRAGGRIADEQAALRRVATLVASGAPPEEVFAAVAAEAGQLLGADLTGVGRYEPGDVLTVLGAWSSAESAGPPLPRAG